MAKPILKTPDLENDDAKRFLSMHNDLVLTSEKQALLDSFVKTYKLHKK